MAKRKNGNISEKSQSIPPKQVYTISETEHRWRKFLDNSGYGNNYWMYYFNFNNYWSNSPFLLNQRLKNLTTHGMFMNREKIEEALTHPQDSELALRSATHSIIGLTYPLYRLQYLYEGLLTYRSYIQPVYVTKEDMSKCHFKSDWKLVDKWHKKLNPPKQFRRIVAEVLPEGKRAYYLRQSYCKQTGRENVNYVHFESLPSDFYKIIKHSTDSYEVVAFNFTYFWQPGTNLGQFPPIFQKYFEELMGITIVGNNGVKRIDLTRVPADAVVEYNHQTATFFYWKELPANECFTFCFTEADDLQCSPFIPLLLQAQDLGSYSLLQQQLLSVPLYSILTGEMPYAEHNKAGSQLDDFAISPESMQMFEAAVNALMPPGTSYKVVPTKNNELHHFEEIPNANEIYNKGLQQLINTAGVSTLLTTTDKPSVAQVNAGKIIETRFIDRMYAQFAWACNIILRDMYDRGDLKYHWHFRIFGDAFSEEKKIDQLEKSVSLGQVQFFPEYLAYRDMSMMDAISSADWVESTGLYDKFKPLVNSFSQTQTKNTTSSGGRPRVSEDNVDNDSTAASIDSGTNLQENR